MNSNSVQATQLIPFPKHPNFSLFSLGWGQVHLNDIVVLLDWIISDYYSYLNPKKIEVKDVIIVSDNVKPVPLQVPQTVFLPLLNFIFLTAKDRLWSQYTYQFLHEICHHVINSDWLGKTDDFGWFEESLCELTSLYFLQKLAIIWQTNPPYTSWLSYAPNLKSYADDVLKNVETIHISFNQWIFDNINYLKTERVDRKKNAVVAMHLLPLFTANPDLWQTIQLIKDVPINRNMDFHLFLSEWKNLLPDQLKDKFSNIQLLFTGKLEN